MTQIKEYSKVEAALSELRATYSEVPDATTDEGYNACKIGARDVGKYRIELEKKRKEIKAPALERCKLIDSEAKKILEELAAIENPLKLAYKRVDDERKERERVRNERISAAIEEFRNAPADAINATASEVSDMIERFQSNDCSEGFYERTSEALMVRNKALDSLSVMFKQKVLAEQQAAEAAKKEEEIERLRAMELELIKEKERGAQKKRDEEIAAAARIEAEKRAQEAEERAKQAEIEAAEAAKAAEERAKIQAQEAEERAKQAEIEAAEAAKAAEERAKIQAQEAAEAARLAEIDRQEKEAAEAKAAQEELEANKRHVSKICKAAKESLINKCGIDESLAKEIIKAIAKSEIDNISINY